MILPSLGVLTSKYLRCSLGVLLCLLGLESGGAATFTWTNRAGDSFKDSVGNDISDANLKFELGTWETGFTPTAGNVSLWDAYWKPMDQAVDPAVPGGWNHLLNFYQSTAILTETTPQQAPRVGESDSSPLPTSPLFGEGEQLYIWMFTDKGSGSEWALFTSSDSKWRTPAYGDTHGGLSVDLNLTEADTDILGTVDENPPPGLQSTVQAAFVVFAVPEPSTALLVLTGGMLALVRRQRRIG